MILESIDCAMVNMAAGQSDFAFVFLSDPDGVSISSGKFTIKVNFYAVYIKTCTMRKSDTCDTSAHLCSLCMSISGGNDRFSS